MGSGRRGGGSRIGFVSSAFDWAVDVDLNSFTTGLMGMAVIGVVPTMSSSVHPQHCCDGDQMKNQMTSLDGCERKDSLKTMLR